MPLIEAPGLQLNALQYVQLLLLILALPLQYFLTRQSSESYRQYEIDRVFSHIKTLGRSVFNITSWLNWCAEKLFVIKLDNFEAQHLDDVREAAKEQIAMEKPTKEEHFGLSLKPRYIRPPSVLYRVGHVIRHKKRGFKGVIIGWDEKVKAPHEWLRINRPENKTQWNEDPNYAVLLDTHTVSTVPQVGYIVQENIEVVTNTPIVHALLESYFEYFNGEVYVMRPWLREVYPNDQHDPWF